MDELGVASEHVERVQGRRDFGAHAEEALTTLVALTSRQRVRTLVLGHPELLCAPLGVWLDFLTAYGLTRPDVCKLLGSNPELFTRGSLFNVGNVMAYLQSLGLSPRDVVASVISRCAGLLLRDLYDDIIPVVAFLRDELGLEQGALGNLLCRCPAVLCRDVTTELAPRLEALCAAGFERQVACQVLYENASLLVGDVSSTLSQRQAFLQLDCGFSAPQAQAVLTRCPQLLALTVPNLARKWRFLRERMQGGREQVLAYPQFWSKNLLLQIGPRYSYLAERLPDLPPPPPPATPLPKRRLDDLAGQGQGQGEALWPQEWGSSRGADPHAATAAPPLVSTWPAVSSADAAADWAESGSSSPCTCGSQHKEEASSISTAGVGMGGAVGCGLDLQMLLEPDDEAFVALVWSPGGEAAIRGQAGPSSSYGTGIWDEAGPLSVGRGPRAEGVGEEESGAGRCTEGVRSGTMWVAPYLEHYQRFRAEWLEREGARWTGVRAGAGMAGGSW